jgi:hypothetical protein
LNDTAQGKVRRKDHLVSKTVRRVWDTLQQG